MQEEDTNLTLIDTGVQAMLRLWLIFHHVSIPCFNYVLAFLNHLPCTRLSRNVCGSIANAAGLADGTCKAIKDGSILLAPFLCPIPLCVELAAIKSAMEMNCIAHV